MKALKRIFRPMLWVIFAIYAYIVIYICFFSRELKTEYSICEYFKLYSNILPFKTITTYVRLYFDGYAMLAWANIFGNFILLLPLGMFLPCLNMGINRFWKVVLVSFVIIVCIEGLQCVFRVGIVDIDDLILNLCGSMLGYALIRIPIVYRSLCKNGVIEDGEKIKYEEP